MANRNYPNSRIYSGHYMPVQVDAVISIGATGAPTIESAPLVHSITRLAAGQYRIQLQDNYNSLLDFRGTAQSPVSGGAVAGGSFSIGTVYQIVSLGNTTQAQWVTAGLPSGITAAVGDVFKAAAIGAGTGTVKVLGSSGIACMELMGNNAAMLKNQVANTANNGGYVDFQCMGLSIAGSSSAPVLTMNSYTPAGTNDASSPPIFTGTPAVLTGTVSAPTITATASMADCTGLSAGARSN